ncbi:MAG: metal-dependent hydrolase [Desulfobaccales bacterium]
MDPLTHVTAGVGLSRLLRSPAPRRAALLAAGFALLPDADFLLLFIDRVSYLRHHRGLTHSLFMLPVLALLGGLLARWLGGRQWFRPAVLLGVVVLASHLFLDVLTSYGTQLLSPFSRQKFTLDLLFIVDIYLLMILAPGAVAGFVGGTRRWPAVLSLSLALGYLALVGWYHSEALRQARQLFGPEAVSVAALPQPFSPRRWHLVATLPEEWREAFVELPWRAADPAPGNHPPRVVTVRPAFPPRVPEVSWRPPAEAVVLSWPAQRLDQTPAPEAAWLLSRFLEFARFPQLAVVEQHPGFTSATWVDLRFSLPGAAFPFALTLDLDEQGRLVDYDWGRGRRWGVFTRPKTVALEGPQEALGDGG